MRKTIIEPEAAADDVNRKNLDVSTARLLEHAEVEITSEDPAFPIEDALTARGIGWRAGRPGRQTVRLRFDPAVAIREIELRIVEREQTRSQEFALYVQTAGGSLREMVRQQFSFSPDGATEEVERYQPQLAGVVLLELQLDPDRSHDPTQSRTYATLASLRLG